jgi:hypothetical protein
MNKYEEAVEAFVDECRFAKVVETPRGSAILVAGKIIDVSGPPPFGGDVQPNYAHALVTALRRGAAQDVNGIVGIANAGRVGTAA